MNLWVLTIVPDVAGYGLGPLAPGIEHVDHGLERAAVRPIDGLVLDVGLVADLLVVGRVPRGGLLVIRVDGGDGGRAHDVGPPFLGLLLARRLRLSGGGGGGWRRLGRGERRRGLVGFRRSSRLGRRWFLGSARHGWSNREKRVGMCTLVSDEQKTWLRFAI